MLERMPEDATTSSDFDAIASRSLQGSTCPSLPAVSSLPAQSSRTPSELCLECQGDWESDGSHSRQEQKRECQEIGQVHEQEPEFDQEDRQSPSEFRSEYEDDWEESGSHYSDGFELESSQELE